VSAVRVLAETAYPLSAPSPRVRLSSFAPHLRAHRVELDVHTNLSTREYEVIASVGGAPRKAAVLARAGTRLLLGARRRSAAGPLLVHRLRFLLPLPGVEPARTVDAYDFDDALWLGSILTTNRRFRLLKREAENWQAYARRARLVIAGNDYLAGHAAKHAGRVEVVPSCVDPARQPLREHGEREVVTIGWIGSRSTVDQLRTVLPAIASLNSSGLRARLVLVGAGGLDSRADWLEQRPWSLEREAADLASFDLGIMPMPDTEWTRGKCGYKLLQYFSAGVPAVASPVGVNTRIVGESEERGLLATSGEEWSAALERLVSDHSAREEMGAEARSFVEREYSYQRWAPELAAMLAEL
jgi:glycosyltransferase involved in cell wall biosynthesis